MKTITAIIKKELKSYFNSPVAYIFITVFLILSSWIFFRTFFFNNQASMRNFFSLMPFLFLFIIPAITMRLWSEEKKLGTLEVLMTLPVKDIDVVIGKFLGTLIFLFIMLVLSLPVAIIVVSLGKVDLGAIMTGYLGLLLMGAAYISIGLFVSSFTKNQIISFIVAIAISFFLLVIGQEIVTYFVPQQLVPLLQYIGLSKHFDSIMRGVIDSRDIIYYFSITSIFLYLNAKVIEKWKSS